MLLTRGSVLRCLYSDCGTPRVSHSEPIQGHPWASVFWKPRPLPDAGGIFSGDNKGGDPGPMVWSIFETPPPSLGHALRQVGG